MEAESSKMEKNEPESSKTKQNEAKPRTNKQNEAKRGAARGGSLATRNLGCLAFVVMNVNDVSIKHEAGTSNMERNQAKSSKTTQNEA